MTPRTRPKGCSIEGVACYTLGSMRTDGEAELVARTSLSADAQLLTLRCPELARNFEPGQFTMVRLPTDSVLLRRPYSICDIVDERPECFTLLVKAAGRGTSVLMQLAEGATLHCLGPLGTSFTLPEASDAPVIVAGGVGIAPFVGFCRRLSEAGRRAVVVLGGRSEPDLYLRSHFERFGMEVRCTTEDGSFGHRGRVTDVLAEILGETSGARLYSCGPSAMLAAVAAIASEADVRHQVSVERRMGCGMGCCWACVVYMDGAAESGGGAYARSCTVGPVLDAARIAWERDPYPL